MNKKITYGFLFIILVQLTIGTELQAQCAMCRAVLESEADGSTAKGVNNGIKYLMIIPYLLVGGVFYAIYRARRNEKEKIKHQQ